MGPPASPSVRRSSGPQVSQVEAGSLTKESGSQADRTSYFGGRCRPRPVGRPTAEGGKAGGRQAGREGGREGLSIHHLPVQSREQEMLATRSLAQSVTQSVGR